MVVALMWSIMAVARARVRSAAINPLSGNDHLIQLHKNFLSNTMEQLLVAFLSLIIFTSYIEEMKYMRLVPPFVVNFVVARILFRIGYGIHPDYRGFGFVMTSFPTAIVIMTDAYLLLTKGAGFTVEQFLN